MADSEASAVRAVPLDPRLPVTTVVGRGLFEFGDRDGAGDGVRLQHPLGLTLRGGELLVADTFNHKIKRILPAKRACRTLWGSGHAGISDSDPGEFDEPGDVCVAGSEIFIADTNNHVVRRGHPERGLAAVEMVGLL